MARMKQDKAEEAAPLVAAETLPSLAEAEAALKRGMVAYRAFEEAHKAISVLANLETVANERKAAAAAATAQAEEAKAALDAAQSELAAVQAQARAVTVEAQAKADAVIDSAQAKAKTVEAAAAAKIAELDAKADKLTADLVQAQVELDDLSKQAEQARAVIARAEAIKAAMG
jgi:hypothetical protein